VKGKGDSEYNGAGAMGRFDFKGNETGHAWAEASIQAGRVETDFHSGVLIDTNSKGAKYRTKSAYAGAGYTWKHGAAGEADLYGKLLYTRRAADREQVVKFGAVESKRARIGACYT
jgi:hypothetical protein